MEHVIDAQNQKLGRVATEAAKLLMGKGAAGFSRHTVADVAVRIIHAGELAISPKKAEDKVYTRYTGHPGGLKKERLADVLEKKGAEEVLRRAVYGMLPPNKLRARLMKRLTVEK